MEPLDFANIKTSCVTREQVLQKRRERLVKRLSAIDAYGSTAEYLREAIKSYDSLIAQERRGARTQENTVEKSKID